MPALPGRDPLAGRFPMSCMRVRRRLVPEPSPAVAVSRLPTPELGHRGDRSPPLAPAADRLVHRRLPRRLPQARRLGPPARPAARGPLRDGQADAPQAAAGDGQPATRPALGRGRGGRDLDRRPAGGPQGRPPAGRPQSAAGGSGRRTAHEAAPAERQDAAPSDMARPAAPPRSSPT